MDEIDSIGSSRLEGGSGGKTHTPLFPLKKEKQILIIMINGMFGMSCTFRSKMVSLFRWIFCPYLLGVKILTQAMLC